MSSFVGLWQSSRLESTSFQKDVPSRVSRLLLYWNNLKKIFSNLPAMSNFWRYCLIAPSPVSCKPQIVCKATIMYSHFQPSHDVDVGVGLGKRTVSWFRTSYASPFGSQLKFFLNLNLYTTGRLWFFMDGKWLQSNLRH